MVFDVRPRALAIDFDGTIVNSMPAQESAWRVACRKVDIALNQEAIIIRNLHEGRAGRQMFAGTQLKDDEMASLRRLKDQIWRCIRDDVPLIEGAKATISSVFARYCIYIATTAEASYVANVLNRERMSHFFKMVVTNADVRSPKPAPDMINIIASHAKCSKEEICVIGDSSNDLELSANSGCQFILLLSDAIDRHRPSSIRTGSWLQIEAMLH